MHCLSEDQLIMLLFAIWPRIRACTGD